MCLEVELQPSWEARENRSVLTACFLLDAVWSHLYRPGLWVLWLITEWYFNLAVAMFAPSVECPVWVWLAQPGRSQL